MAKDKERNEEDFNVFIDCCAETIHFALHISDKRWEKADKQEIENVVVKLTNDIVLSVVGNRNLTPPDFTDSDYDLIFVATLRKALSLVDDGSEEF